MNDLFAKTLYEALRDAGVPLDHHESDLYAKVTDASRAIIGTYIKSAPLISSTFRSRLDGELWFEIPFAYQPWWEARAR